MATAATQLALPSGEREVDDAATVHGVLTLIVSGIVVMGALGGAYLAFRSGNHPWPAKGVVLQDYYGNTLAITAMMAAGISWWGVYAVRRDEPRQAGVSMALVILMLGALVNLDTYVLRQAKFGPGSSPYGLIYYALNAAAIGFAAIGIIAAAVNAGRVLGGQVTSRRPALAWATAWYTSFVAVAVLIVYSFVYQVK